MATPVVRTKISRVGKVVWHACDTPAPSFANSIFCVVCDSPVAPGWSKRLGCTATLDSPCQRSGWWRCSTSLGHLEVDLAPCWTSTADEVLFHCSFAGIRLWQHSTLLCLQSLIQNISPFNQDRPFPHSSLTNALVQLTKISQHSPTRRVRSVRNQCRLM